LKKRIKIPGNITDFVAPKINLEFRKILPSHARLNDLQSQQIQQSLGMELSEFANMANAVLSAGDNISKEIRTNLLKYATDGAHLLGDQFQTLSVRRRMEIKKFLNPEYSGICTTEVLYDYCKL